MNKRVVALALVAVVFSAFAINATIERHHENENIKAAIEDGYVHGAFNELNPEAMRKTFHEDFAIFSTDGKTLNKYPIDTWANGVERRKNSERFNPDDNVWEHKFSDISYDGNAASVKLELHHKGEHVYTDYLSLLKFDDGWKIVAKVYHQHNQ